MSAAKINDGGRAFPWCGDLNQTPHIELGMSLRDYFAAAALQGALAYPKVSLENWRTDQYATYAYSLADAMLKARAAS